MLDDLIDPVAAAAVERRREQVRVTARQLLAAHAAGATVDPHSLQWARDVKALGRPANGWLGEEQCFTAVPRAVKTISAAGGYHPSHRDASRTPARICNPETPK